MAPQAMTSSVAEPVSDEPANPTRVDLRDDVRAMELAYVWDLATDVVHWDPMALRAFGFKDPSELPRTGRAFEALIGNEHKQRHRGATRDSASTDEGQGVSFRVSYRIAPFGPRTATSLWIEDQGRWWAGVDGRPARVRGTMRVRPADDERAGEHGDLDDLTGLASRVRLLDALAAVAARAMASGEGPDAAFLIVSIDNLAEVNATFGVETGDALIRGMADRMKTVVRGGDTMGRFSSGKFGIVLEMCDASELTQAAERIVDALRRDPIELDGAIVMPLLSYGATAIPSVAKTPNDAITEALNELRMAGGHTHDVRQHVQARPARMAERLETVAVAERVGRALRKNQFELALQPVVRVRERTPAFYEALLRVRSPDEENFSAAQFMPIVEQLGLSSHIDRHTLRLAQNLLWSHPNLHLSLNVSALTCGDQGWLDELRSLKRKRPGVLERLIVEITETVAVQDLDQLMHFADSVRDVGCRIALDDFGAGHTSFTTLQKLRFDVLKIDGGFVRGLTKSETDQHIVRCVLDLARSLGMETVAEWVGDEETSRMLETLGADYLQGFHVGRPIRASHLPADAF